MRGRYSMLGLDPDLLFRATGATCEVNRAWRHDRAAFAPLEGDSLTELRALAESCRLDVPGELPPALACLVGYLGYETIGLVEKLPRAPQSDLALPDLLFVRPTLVLVFDGLTDALFVIAPLWAGASRPEWAIEAAAERIDNALRRLAEPAPRSPREASLPEMALSPAIAGEDYRAMVLAAKEYITAGDIFQVVLAQRFTCPFPLPPLSLYRALQTCEPLSVPLFPRLAWLRGGRLEPRDPGARARERGDHPPDRRHPPARTYGHRGCGQRKEPARPTPRSAPST